MNLFTFELLAVISTFLFSVGISIVSYVKFTEDKSEYKPFKFIWAKSFMAMGFVMLLNLIYMIIFGGVELPYTDNVSKFRMMFASSIKVMETFAVLEFLKISFYIRSSKNNFKYITKESQFWLETIPLFSLTLIPLLTWGAYDRFFEIPSILLHSQVVGFKGVDIAFNGIHAVSFFFAWILIKEKTPGENFQVGIIRSINLFNFLQKILQVLNIAAFDYTILIFVYLEWIPAVFSSGQIFYQIAKEFIEEKIKK